MHTPKLFLRDVFAIVTLSAVLVGWWMDHRQLSKSRDAILIDATLEAAVSQQQLKATEKMLDAMIRKFEPDRIGTGFEFSSDAGGGASAPGPSNRGPTPAPSGDEGASQGTQGQPPTTSLYTDSEVRQVVEQWTAPRPNDEALLRVVPSGSTAPLVTVFGALGFDLARLGKPEESAANHVVFLTWRVSPSYRLSCMTAINDPDFKGIGYVDPRRPLYGIRIGKHSE